MEIWIFWDVFDGVLKNFKLRPDDVIIALADSTDRVVNHSRVLLYINLERELGPPQWRQNANMILTRKS